MSSLKEIKDAARQAFRDQQTQDTEGGAPDIVSFVTGFVAGALLYERKRSELKQIELERLVVHMGREMQKERDQKELLIQALEKIASNWSEDYREDAYQALQKVKK
jgi:hypothetical protein